MDVHSPSVRSKNMRAIRSKNTKPEICLRKALHAKGFRFRLNVRKLPGTPDIVLPKYRAAIFVHGCFWHGHGCHLFKWPKTNPDFWKKKITRNREVDVEVENKLKAQGWRYALVWECALKGKARGNLDDSVDRLDKWLRSSCPSMIIESNKNADGEIDMCV